MTIVVFRAMLARGSRTLHHGIAVHKEEGYPSAHTATPQLSLEEEVSPEIEAMVLSHRKEVVSRVWVAVVAVVVLVPLGQEVLRALLVTWVVRPQQTLFSVSVKIERQRKCSLKPPTARRKSKFAVKDA